MLTQRLTYILALSLALAVVNLLSSCDQNRSSQPGSPSESHKGVGENDVGTSDRGGGGTGAQAEWKSLADEIEEDIRRLAVSKLADADLLKIKTLLPKLRKTEVIEFKTYPLLLGIERADKDNPSAAIAGKNYGDLERDAINFPLVTKIKVNTPRFLAYSPDSVTVRRLVLHEYLGLMGFSEQDSGQTQYKYSNALLNDFKTIKKIDPTGTQIVWLKTCADFADIGISDSHFDETQKDDPAPEITWKLAGDIDCGGFDFDRYFPIGLNGNLDGNGYSITHLNMHSGLAPISHVCSLCTITSLGMTGAHVHGLAGLVRVNEGVISHCHFEGSIEQDEKPISEYDVLPLKLAGLVAENRGILSASVASAILISTNKDLNKSSWIGGLVATNNGQISNSKTHTIVHAESAFYFGGLVGENDGSIVDSQAQTQAVLKNAVGVGGIAGINAWKIENSSATGSIRIQAKDSVQFDDSSALMALYLMPNDPQWTSMDSGIGGIIGLMARHQGGTQLGEGMTKRPFSLAGSKSDVAICGQTHFTYSGVWGSGPDFSAKPQPEIGKRTYAIEFYYPNALKETKGSSNISPDCPVK